MAREYLDVDAIKLETLRAKLNWSQKELAEKSHLHLRTIQNVTRGGLVYLPTAVHIANALEVEPRALTKDNLPAPSNKESKELRFSDYQGIWMSSLTVPEKLSETSKLYSQPHAQTIALEENITININKSGDAVIRYDLRLANVGPVSIRGEMRRLWFQNAPLDSVRVTGMFNQKKPLRIDMIRELPDSKHFFCCFPHPLQQFETCRYSYEVTAKKVFVLDHFWDVSISRLTNSISLTINQEHRKKLLRACNLRVTSSEGISRMETPPVSFTQDQDQHHTKIKWSERFPLAHATYSLQWEFAK